MDPPAAVTVRASQAMVWTSEGEWETGGQRVSSFSSQDPFFAKTRATGEGDEMNSQSASPGFSPPKKGPFLSARDLEKGPFKKSPTLFHKVAALP